MQHYAPGEVATRTGFSIDTLRYYERIGLLTDVARTGGGKRMFTDGDIAWLGVLRCLRETGMPIAQMLRYAELARGGDETVAARLALLEEHDQVVVHQIDQLRGQQEHVREKIAFYRSVLTDRNEDAVVPRAGAR